MAVNGILFCQCIATEFITKENSSAANTFDIFCNFFGDSIMDVRGVQQWMTYFGDANRDVTDLPCSD
jgi:hypothetical protein